MSAIVGTAWRCHAKPANLGGRSCGHLNIPGDRVLRAAMGGGDCCAECGCTRIAGTDRYKRSKPTQAGLWIVVYETRADERDHFDETRITVIASSTDDAYREAQIELGEELQLGLPVSAEPVVRQ